MEHNPQEQVPQEEQTALYAVNVDTDTHEREETAAQELDPNIKRTFTLRDPNTGTLVTFYGTEADYQIFEKEITEEKKSPQEALQSVEDKESNILVKNEDGTIDLYTPTVEGQEQNPNQVITLIRFTPEHPEGEVMLAIDPNGQIWKNPDIPDEELVNIGLRVNGRDIGQEIQNGNFKDYNDLPQNVKDSVQAKIDEIREHPERFEGTKIDKQETRIEKEVDGHQHEQESESQSKGTIAPKKLSLGSLGEASTDHEEMPQKANHIANEIKRTEEQTSSLPNH